MLGNTTTSTAASDLGMALYHSFASQSPTQRLTSTSSVATFMVARILSELGVRGQPTSTVCRWKALLVSENARMNQTSQFHLAAFQCDQTLFMSSWFSRVSFAVFHASFLFRCLLMTLSHPRQAVRPSTASSTLLYVYTMYVSCLPLPFIFS